MFISGETRRTGWHLPRELMFRGANILEYQLKVKENRIQEKENLEEKCLTFENFYNEAVNGKGFYVCDCKVTSLLEFIVSFGDENVFPNLCVAFQILLTV